MQAGGRRFDSDILHHGLVDWRESLYKGLPPVHDREVLRQFILAILDERPEISVEGFSGLTVDLQVKQKGHKADALAPGSEEGRGQLR